MAMAILMAGAGAGVGDSTWSIAIAANADIPPTSDDVSILSSSSVASSSSSSSAVIESMVLVQPPSAISGKALVLPDNVAENDDTSTDAGDLAAAPGKNDDEKLLLEEFKSVEATADVESSPISPPATSSSIGDMDLTKSDLAMKGQIQEEAPATSAAAASATAAAVVAEEQSSVAKLIDNNNNNYDGQDANSNIAMISKMGYNKYNAAILPKPVENLSLVVAPVAIVTALVLLASPSTNNIQEDAGKSEDAVVENNIIPSSTASGGEQIMDKSNILPGTSLKGADTMTDGKNTDQGRRQKEWKRNAPVPYGLQESTPKWSSLPPPPPKKKIVASVITPLFVSPSSSTPTLAQPEQVVKETSIDRGGFRSSATTPSPFGTSAIIGNDSSSSSPSLSQAIKQPQKGSASMGGGNSPTSSLSSSAFFAKQQQKGWSSTPPITASVTTTDVSIPKSYAKSTYKKSSVTASDQRLQSSVAPNVAPTTTSSGGGTANAVPVSSSSVSETMGRGMMGRSSTTSSITTTDASVPKSFAKSAYKMSSLNKKSDQRPQSFVAPNVAASAASPGGGNANAVSDSISGGVGSETMDTGMIKGQRGDDGNNSPVNTWSGTMTKGATFVGGGASIANTLKGTISTPAASISNIPKKVSPSTSSDSDGSVPPPTTTTTSAATIPKSYAKSSYKKSSTTSRKTTEQSMPPNYDFVPAPDTPAYAAGAISGVSGRNEDLVGNTISTGGMMLKGQKSVGSSNIPKSYSKSSFKSYKAPAPATPSAAGAISGGFGRNEGTTGNGISTGGMLKGQRSVGSGSPKSYSKTTFKSFNNGSTSSPGTPGGGYLTDLSDIPSSPSSSISSMAGASPAAVAKEATGGVSGSGSVGEKILKGTTGAPSGEMESTPSPLFGKGPSMRFGRRGVGGGSFTSGSVTVSDGQSSTSTAESAAFLSDLVQATVPSTLSPSTPSPMLGDQTGGSPSQLASMIPQTSSTPTIPTGIGAQSQPRLLSLQQQQQQQQVPMTTVRIGSATRIGSPTATGISSQGNANQRGWNNPGLNRIIEEPSTPDIRSIGLQRPQSVTITDPRTGKQRTISVSTDVNVPE